MPKLSSYSPLSASGLLGSGQSLMSFTVVGPAGSFADYVCDGVADQVEINNAILTGGHVFVRKGTYNLSGPLTFATNNVVFEGEGPLTVFSKGNFNQNIINVTASNVLLQNFKFIGNRSIQTTDNHGLVAQLPASNITLRGLIGDDIIHHGINTTAIGVTIDDCMVTNTGSATVGGGTADGVGIIVGVGGSNMKVINCTTDSTGYHGIQVYGPGADEVFINNCHVTKPGLTQATGSGIKVNPGDSNIHISDCSFDGTGSGGSSPGVLLIADTALPCDRIQLSNVTVTGFGQAGIELEGATNVTILGGQIFNNGTTASASLDYGIRVTDGISAGVFGNHISIIGTKIFDNQGSPTQARPIGLYGGSTNILVANCEFYGHATSNLLFKDAAFTGTLTRGKSLVTLGPQGSGADFLTTGANDEVMLLNAVSSLPGNGGEVYVQPGTYNFSGAAANIPQNVKLTGSGYGTLFKLVGAGTILHLLDGLSSSPPILHNDIQNIRFEGNFTNSIAIDCGAYGQDFLIKNNWFRSWGVGSSCIYAGTTNKKMQLEGNYFGTNDGASFGGVYYCIRLSATGDVQIVGNDFHEFFMGVYGDTEKTQIVGNDFYSADATFADSACVSLGVSLGGLEICNLTGNTFSNVDWGIRVGQSGGKGMNIGNNFFRNINKNAIWIRGTDHSIMGNYFQDIAITGTGNDASGLFLADGAARIKIIGNNINNSHTNMSYGYNISDQATGNNTIVYNSAVGAQTAVTRTGTSLNNTLNNNTGA